MNTTENKLLALVVTLALFWLGLLAGVSFLATPVKFMAPSLSLPVALDVGRQTFSVFNPLELLLGGVIAGGCVVPLSSCPRNAAHCSDESGIARPRLVPDTFGCCRYSMHEWKSSCKVARLRLPVSTAYISSLIFSSWSCSALSPVQAGYYFGTS
jgi:hypothetical protein